MDMSNLGLGTDNPFLGTGNPYLQQIIDSASGDLTRNFNQVVRPANNAAMLRSGSFGNSGLDEMNARDERGLQTQLGDVASKLRFNDYGQQQQEYNWQQGFGRDLFNDAYSQNMNNLTTGMGLLGGLQGTNAQDVAATTTQQNAPLNYWQQMANQATGIGSGFGTTNTSGTQGTTSNPMLTALGGAQLGNQAMNWWNRTNPGTTGTSGNSYAGTSTDYTAPNYENQMDRGYGWGDGNR